MADSGSLAGQNWLSTPKRREDGRLSSLPTIKAMDDPETLLAMEFSTQTAHLNGMEKPLRQQMDDLCSKNRITPVALMEAFLLHLDGLAEGEQAKIIASARKRREIRVRLGEIRRAQAVLKKQGML